MANSAISATAIATARTPRNLANQTAAALSIQRPPNGVHSIWEIVLHMTGWRREVAARASGKAAGEPEGGDWPPPGDPTPARWAAALAALDEAHERLVRVVHGMTNDQLWTPTNDPRDRPLGTGVIHYELLQGILQHDAYHAGQIAMLRKVLGF